MPVPEPLPPKSNLWEPPELGCSGKTIWAVYNFGCGTGNCWAQVERSSDAGSEWDVATPDLPFVDSFSLGGVTSSEGAWFLGYTIADGGVYSLVTTSEGGATFGRSTIYPQMSNAVVNVMAVSLTNASEGWADVTLTTGKGTASPKSSSTELVGTVDGGATWRVVSLIPGM